MKSLSCYITESLQELYHFTNAGNLINIIKDDEWVSSMEENGEMYISTTRSKNASTGYATQLIDETNIVRIVFDGQKLNSKFKIKPVDKMRGKWQAIKANWNKCDPEVWNQNKENIMKQGNVESEDRVFVHDETIPNIHKYIKSIHINLENINSEYINPIEDYCNKYDIEFRKYKNTKKFNLGN